MVPEDVAGPVARSNACVSLLLAVDCGTVAVVRECIAPFLLLRNGLHGVGSMCSLDSEPTRIVSRRLRHVPLLSIYSKAALVRFSAQVQGCHCLILSLLLLLLLREGLAARRGVRALLPGCLFEYKRCSFG